MRVNKKFNSIFQKVNTKHLAFKITILSLIVPIITLFMSCVENSSGGGDSEPTGLVPLTGITATQVKITDVNNTGQTVFPAYFMVFDIVADAFTGEARDLEFMLYPASATTPTTLAEFRKTATLTYSSGGVPATKLYLPTIIKSGETSSIYIGHDANAALGLNASTNYVLYVVQPDTRDTNPTNLGTFTTGPAVTANTPVFQQDLGILQAMQTRKFYVKDEALLALAFALNDFSKKSFVFEANTIPILSHVGVQGVPSNVIQPVPGATAVPGRYVVTFYDLFKDLAKSGSFSLIINLRINISLTFSNKFSFIRVE